VLWATPRYGAAGAAWAWVALNIGYMTIGMHFMHRRLLSAEKVTWYVKDLLSPIAAAALATYAFVLILSEPFGTVLTVCLLGLCGMTALLAGAFSADRLRQRLFDVWPLSAARRAFGH
jgi:O-antigen/teichoic acid export membrane protein